MHPHRQLGTCMHPVMHAFGRRPVRPSLQSNRIQPSRAKARQKTARTATSLPIHPALSSHEPCRPRAWGAQMQTYVTGQQRAAIRLKKQYDGVLRLGYAAAY